MSEDASHCNKIDQQLSSLSEGDIDFKNELISIYTDYMHEIPESFAFHTRHSNTEELALLHHKHKTTCHVLALQELSDVFDRARKVLTNPPVAPNTIDELIRRVESICNTTLSQLNEIDRSSTP